MPINRPTPLVRAASMPAHFSHPFSYFRHRPDAPLVKLSQGRNSLVAARHLSVMTYLVPEMNFFRIAIRCKAKGSLQTLDISNVRICDEGRGVGFSLVAVRKLEKFQHGVRRAINARHRTHRSCAHCNRSIPVELFLRGARVVSVHCRSGAK